MLHFTEFMSITEGDAVNFDDFLNFVHKTGGNLSSINLKDRQEASASYAQEEAAAKGHKLEAQPSGAQPAQLPPGIARVQCYACAKPFGVPTSAQAAQCPHCGATQKVAVSA
jgi:hypothetical protein